jgi:hypothetical protein
MTQDRIAATIAYSMDGLTFSQRMVVAEAFANDFRLTGKRRDAFIDKCKKFSETEPVHTVRGGKPAREFGGYGVTHDMDCPGCQDTSFLASPRSETYWSS